MNSPKHLLLIFCTFVCVSFAAPSAFAVEKKEKSATASTPKPSAADSSTKKKTADSVRRFDTFIDANKNGIDDRREKTKLAPGTADRKQPKKPPPQQPQDTTSSKKP